MDGKYIITEREKEKAPAKAPQSRNTNVGKYRKYETAYVVERRRRKVRKRLSVLWFIIPAAVILLVFLLWCLLKPNFALKGDADVTVNVFDDYVDEGYSAKLLWIDLSEKVRCGSDPSCEELGQFEKEYVISFLGREWRLVRTINVVDSVPPELILNGETEKTISSVDLYTEEGFSAIDNYDGDLTDRVEIIRTYDSEASILTLRYIVRDSSGGETAAERHIKVQDVIPPVLVLSGDSEITTSSCEFTDPGYCATDDLDGDITAKVITETDYKPYTTGDFTFEYSVSDSSGNTVFAKRILHVEDNTAPWISLLGEGTIYIHQGDVYNDPGVKVSDDFDGDISDSVSVSGSVDSGIKGTYTITYSAEDSKGNSASASRSVVVVAAPVVLDVPYINQEGSYPNGCESVSTVMALQWAGINISVDRFIDSYLDMCELPYYDENGVRWGNSPWQYFLGDPRKSTGLCCYAPVIKNACNKFVDPGKYQVLDMYGVPLETLCEDYVSNNTPVIIWATIKMKRPYINNMHWNLIGTSGEVFNWTAPMHCVLLVGFDDDYYYVNDPLDGKSMKYSKSKVEAAYNGLFSQAVVIRRLS